MSATPAARLVAVAALALGSTVAAAPDQHFALRDSYPAEALRLRQQGRVVMRLSVSATGTVTACAVTQSSGSPSLDAAACDTAPKRVRYAPATDADGTPIESTTTFSIRYVLPG